MARPKSANALITVAAKLEPDLVGALDAWARAQGKTRSMALRMLLREILEDRRLLAKVDKRVLAYAEGIRLGLADAKRGITEATSELWP